LRAQRWQHGLDTWIQPTLSLEGANAGCDQRPSDEHHHHPEQGDRIGEVRLHIHPGQHHRDGDHDQTGQHPSELSSRKNLQRVELSSPRTGRALSHSSSHADAS